MIESKIFPEPTLSTEEVAQAAHHLCVSRELLVDCVSGLSDTQWNFKPAADAWSTVEILEHLIILETRVHAMIRNLANAPQSENSAGQKGMDQTILAEVPKRGSKVKAPEPVWPAHRWSTSEVLQQFLVNREQTIQLLDAPMLRGRVYSHPIFGPWDGYQWLLAIAAHNNRHTAQIREIQADLGYPH